MRRIFMAALAAAALLGGGHAKADITIGSAGPMTGSDAAFGEQLRRGAEMAVADIKDRKSTRLNSSHIQKSRMPSSA